jgi:hypothetical protein
MDVSSITDGVLVACGVLAFMVSGWRLHRSVKRRAAIDRLVVEDRDLHDLVVSALERMRRTDRSDSVTRLAILKDIENRLVVLARRNPRIGDLLVDFESRRASEKLGLLGRFDEVLQRSQAGAG